MKNKMFCMEKSDEKIELIKRKCDAFFKKYDVRYTCQQYERRIDRVKLIVECETGGIFCLDSNQIQELYDCGLVEIKFSNTFAKKFRYTAGVEIKMFFS